MTIYRVLPDGTITTDDLDAAIALSEKMAQRHASTGAALRSFSTNTDHGIVTHTPMPPRAPLAFKEATATAPISASIAEKVASLIQHARSNPDTLGILATLQAAGGGEVTTPNLALAIGLDDTVKLSGKLAGIVKTANRLGLDPSLILVRDSAGYNANRVITYCAGKGLLAAPPLQAGGFDPSDFGGAVPDNGGATV